MAVLRVRTGLSNGQVTEVMSRDSTLKEGLKIIAGVLTGGTADATTSTATNPFQPQQQQQRGFRGPPGGF